MKIVNVVRDERRATDWALWYDVPTPRSAPAIPASVPSALADDPGRRAGPGADPAAGKARGVRPAREQGTGRR